VEVNGGRPPADRYLTVEYEVADKAVVVTGTGEIDQLTVPLLGSAVSRALREPTHQLVIIDLIRVEFLSSAGVRALALAVHEAQRTQRSVRLVVGQQRPVIRPLELTGLDKVVALYETVDSAIVDSPR
jgi:anti-sigma B factor antagonist